MSRFPFAKHFTTLASSSGSERDSFFFKLPSWETAKLLPVASLSGLFSCVGAPSSCDSEAKFLKRCSLSLGLLEIVQLELLPVEDTLRFPWQDGKTFPTKKKRKLQMSFFRNAGNIQRKKNRAYAKGKSVPFVL